MKFLPVTNDDTAELMFCRGKLWPLISWAFFINSILQNVQCIMLCNLVVKEYKEIRWRCAFKDLSFIQI